MTTMLSYKTNDSLHGIKRGRNTFLVIFCKYLDRILDKTTNPIQEPARFGSDEQTLQIERGLREREKVLTGGLG